jgi:hypothetical protein
MMKIRFGALRDLIKETIELKEDDALSSFNSLGAKQRPTKKQDADPAVVLQIDDLVDVISQVAGVNGGVDQDKLRAQLLNVVNGTTRKKGVTEAIDDDETPFSKEEHDAAFEPWTRKHPDTAEGAKACLKDLSELDDAAIDAATSKPDPDVEGVWALFGVSDNEYGPDAIVYLAGYRDQLHNIRKRNDFETGEINDPVPHPTRGA